MNKLKTILTVVILTMVAFSCDKVDLNPLEERLDELEKRTEQLEAAYSNLLKAQENQIYVSSIVTMDNGIELNMSDGSKIFVPSENSFTPYIGDNENWWVNGIDTGVKATGENGITPNIGDNGNWFIGNVDTGIVAKGTDGQDGSDAPSIVSIQYINEEVIFHFSDSTSITLTMENADEIQKEKDWKAVETDNGYILIEYNGTDTTVVIPNTIYGKPVVGLGINGADSEDYSIIPKKMRLLVKSIDFSQVQSLESINDYAFAGLSKITEITLPECLLTINEHSFDSCTELKTVTILRGIKPYTTCEESSFINTQIKNGTEGSKIVYPVGTPYPTVKFWFLNYSNFYDANGLNYGLEIGAEITLSSIDYNMFSETSNYQNFDLRGSIAPGTDRNKLVEMIGVMLDANHAPIEEDKQYIVTYNYYDGGYGIANISIVKSGGIWIEYKRKEIILDDADYNLFTETSKYKNFDLRYTSRTRMIEIIGVMLETNHGKIFDNQTYIVKYNFYDGSLGSDYIILSKSGKTWFENIY